MAKPNSWHSSSVSAGCGAMLPLVFACALAFAQEAHAQQRPRANEESSQDALFYNPPMPPPMKHPHHPAVPGANPVTIPKVPSAGDGIDPNTPNANCELSNCGMPLPGTLPGALPGALPGGLPGALPSGTPLTFMSVSPNEHDPPSADVAEQAANMRMSAVQAQGEGTGAEMHTESTIHVPDIEVPDVELHKVRIKEDSPLDVMRDASAEDWVEFGPYLAVPLFAALALGVFVGVRARRVCCRPFGEDRTQEKALLPVSNSYEHYGSFAQEDHSRDQMQTEKSPQQLSSEFVQALVGKVDTVSVAL
mmetsp:Transcript_25801/g.48965  ORF Transcript_25801/g.48965 Transcript_25801/m.48965 type:complete len:306 (+) Transcript_25801:237-1154(+)